MDHAVVQNERQQTDIKSVPDDVKTSAGGGVKTVADDAKIGTHAANTQPPDTTTLEGAIANEANPNTNPR